VGGITIAARGNNGVALVGEALQPQYLQDSSQCQQSS